MCETFNAVNKKFEEEDASDDGAQGVVPASADLSGLLEPAPAQTGSLLKLRRRKLALFSEESSKGAQPQKWRMNAKQP